eukprot:5895982-Amphidinium_carterae.1
MTRSAEDNNIDGVKRVLENAEKQKCLRELLARRQYDTGLTGLHVAAQLGWEDVTVELLKLPA